MSILRDESLQDHGRAIRASYDAHADALAEMAGARGLPPAEPWDLLPEAVADAKEEYEAAMNVRLRFLNYARTVNGELEDAMDSGETLPQDPVQLTRSVTVSSSQGAIVILEQWLAEAVAAADPDNGGEV